MRSTIDRETCVTRRAGYSAFGVWRQPRGIVSSLTEKDNSRLKSTAPRSIVCPFFIIHKAKRPPHPGTARGGCLAVDPTGQPCLRVVPSRLVDSTQFSTRMWEDKRRTAQRPLERMGRLWRVSLSQRACPALDAGEIQRDLGRAWHAMPLRNAGEIQRDSDSHYS